jgi:AdoMet-dependent rRNA methyltransferase SPB1
VQLEKQFQFLTSARAIIDLCAAPGGWMQVARKYAPTSAVVIGVDLVPIQPIRGCVALQADITTAQCRALLQREMRDWKVDVVLHDGAPNMGVTWVQDAYTQSELTLHALRLACEFLMPGGVFVSKLFRSKDYNALYWVFTQLFDKVEATKPVASRDVSAEIYVMCKGFKAPKKIDPRLLDPKHVFKEIDTAQPAAKLLTAKKQKANRQGYDDAIGQIVHKRACVTQFLDAKSPGEFLGLFHEITFDAAAPLALDEHGRVFGSSDAALDGDIVPEAVRELVGGKVEQIVSREAAKQAQNAEKAQAKRERTAASMSREATIAFVLAHAKTPTTIASQLRDVRLLPRTDLKKILLWRERMRRARAELIASLQPKSERDDDAESELDSDEKLERELGAELDRADARRNRRDRRLRRLRAKQRAREALGMTQPFHSDATEAREVFDLATMERLDDTTREIVRRGLDGYGDKRAALLDKMHEDASIAKSIRFRLGPDLEDLDSDSLSNDAKVDDLLEVMYEDYKEAARIKAAADRAKRLHGVSSYKRLNMMQETEAELIDEERARRQAAADVDTELRFGRTGAAAAAGGDSSGAKKRRRRRGDGSDSSDESGSSELDDSEERRKLDKLNAVPATVRAAMWYDQALFDGIDGVKPANDDDDDDNDDDDDDADDADGAAKNGKRKRKVSEMSAVERADLRRHKLSALEHSGSGDESGDGFDDDDDDDDFESESENSHDMLGMYGAGEIGRHDALEDMFVSKEANDQDLASESDSENERKVKTRKSKRELEREARRNELTGQKSDKPDETTTFEIVPIDESSEDTDSDKGGQDAQLEALAYARALVNGRRRRDELEDNAFNRRAFADTEAAPSWFVDDERKHQQFSLPVTREDLIAGESLCAARLIDRLCVTFFFFTVRANEISLNARPIKRIVEARMRKQRRAKRRIDRMKLQANAIADQTDIDDKSKMRLLEKLYRGGKAKKEKRERRYVVTGKSGRTHNVKGSGMAVRVDPRMKKEKRAKKAGLKRAKKHSRSTNKKKAAKRN